MNLTLDNRNGTIGNKAHWITLEDLNIIHYGADQQNVRIRTMELA